MNKYFFSIVCLFALSVGFAQATFEFTDEKTQNKLSVISGTKADWETSKQFYINFHKPQYNQIPFEQRKFETIEDLAERVFSDHYTHVFDNHEYQYYVIKDGEKYVGHFIIHIIDNDVYSIETQADIQTYSIKCLLHGFVQFIKQEAAPHAKSFIATARKAVPVYEQLIMGCGFTKTDKIHSDFFKFGEAEYQSYEVKL